MERKICPSELANYSLNCLGRSTTTSGKRWRLRGAADLRFSEGKTWTEQIGTKKLGASKLFVFTNVWSITFLFALNSPFQHFRSTLVSTLSFLSPTPSLFPAPKKRNMGWRHLTQTPQICLTGKARGAPRSCVARGPSSFLGLRLEITQAKWCVVCVDLVDDADLFVCREGGAKGSAYDRG